jgi:hypothetical protein
MPISPWPGGGWLSAGLFMLAVDVAGRLGCGRYCLWSGQAEFGCPALDVQPEAVIFVQVGFGGGVREDQRGDGGVAVGFSQARGTSASGTVVFRLLLPGSVVI